MRETLDPGYKYCPRVGQNVDLRGTEGECRDQHGCADPDCPLARDFGADPMGVRVTTLAGFIGGWPFSGAASAKAPKR